ncbi:Uncharacterised protein [Segatella copri]|nr:Uncharacterised protein [Segatella copri]
MVKSVISSVFTASTMVLSLEPAAVKKRLTATRQRVRRKISLLSEKNCFSGSAAKRCRR